MKILKIIGLIFFLIGLVLLVAGLLSYNFTQKFITNSEVTTGIVIDLVRGTLNSEGSGSGSYVYYPVVQFKTNNDSLIEFQSKVGSNPPSARKGDQVQVRYPEQDPYKARIDSFMQLWFVSIIVGGLGVVFAGIGGIILGLVVRSKQREKWLLENGQIIYAEFDSIIIDTFYRINGKHPYRILSQWFNPQSNLVYVFKNKPLMFNSEKFINSKTYSGSHQSR